MDKEAILEFLSAEIFDERIMRRCRRFLNSLPEIEYEQICPDCEADWLLTPFPYHARICVCDTCLEYKNEIAKRVIFKMREENALDSLSWNLICDWLDSEKPKVIIRK